MTNHKDHLKETEYNLSQVLSNSRLNSEAVVADVLDVSFGTVVLTINGVNGNHFFTRHAILDGSGVGCFTIIIDASGRNIQSGDTMKIDILSGVLATSIFVHDLWNRLWFGNAYDGSTTFVILAGVGLHDIQTLRFEGSFSTDPFFKKNLEIKEIGVRDHATIPCPHCGKVCIERTIMNMQYGYCSNHGKFRFAGVRFNTLEDEIEYSKTRSLLLSTHRGFRNCQNEAIESYNQWLDLEPGILKDSFIFNKFGLETFFTIKDDDEPRQEPLSGSENPLDEGVSKITEPLAKVGSIEHTRNYIIKNGLTIEELYSWCRFGFCELRTWDQVILSGLLFNRI